MIVYGYYDEGPPSGFRAFTSERKARSQRALDYDRPERPELFRIDVGKVTHEKVCALLTGEHFAEEMEDIG